MVHFKYVQFIVCQLCFNEMKIKGEKKGFMKRYGSSSEDDCFISSFFPDPIFLVRTWGWGSGVGIEKTKDILTQASPRTANVSLYFLPTTWSPPLLIS
jgi:hypothetical protein